MSGTDLGALWARAVELHTAERFAEAAGVYGELLSRNPGFVPAYGARGLALNALGACDAALADFAQVLARDPVNSVALEGRAQALRHLGRIDEAAAAYAAISELEPSVPQLQLEIGRLLLDMGRPLVALAPLRRAVEAAPGLAEAHCVLGQALAGAQQFEASLSANRRALELDPTLLAAEFQMGQNLFDLQAPAEALAVYDRLLQSHPNRPEILINRGLAQFMLGRFGEALADYDRSLALRPDDPATLHNRSHIHLALGDFSAGLSGMEWRKRLDPPLGVLDCGQPEWSGAEPIGGKTLYVHSEQGLGDSLQFCRYLGHPGLSGARIVFGCHAPLLRIMASLPGEVEIASGPPRIFDYHIPLLSLPLALGVTIDTISAPTPYLFADPARVARWRRRIGTQGFRIGVVWGASLKGQSTGRTFDPAHLAPIAALPGVRLISLQKGVDAQRLKDLPSGMRIESFDPFDEAENAFLDTAAILESLDLLITADTSVAHLGGALGRPTWLALKYVPDWRWFLDRIDTPWYPDMRLFRQAEPGDWPGVFEAMRARLAAQLAEAAGQTKPA